MAAKKNRKASAVKQTARARNTVRAAIDADVIDPGELEIIFTGLCSFLNLTNTNGTMPPPSVILPRTPDNAKHIPFVAFHVDDIEVTSSTGDAKFKEVTYAKGFLYRELDGVLIRFDDDSIGWPVVLPSYKLLAQKDCYWPEAKNRWDRRYVPEGDDEPDERVVAAYMRLGAGTVGAERLTDFEWEFVAEDGKCTQRAYFAQEVIYRIYPFRHEWLRLVLRRLDNQGDSETLTFTNIRPNSTKVKIWIGNSDQMHKSLLRLSSVPKRAIHFKHLNDVAYVSGSGPIPFPVVPPRLFWDEEKESSDEGQGTEPGSGSDTGYCGPHNPDGG